MPVTREQNYQVKLTNPLLRGGLSMKPWTRLDPPGGDPLFQAFEKNWSGVCWSPTVELFCAVSEGATDGADGAIAISSDGSDWTFISLSPYVGYWMGAHWSDIFDKFFIVSKASAGGSNLQLFSSSDGENWTGHSLPTEREWTSVTTGYYSATPMVMLVSKSGHIAFSDDLSSWTEIGGTHYYNAVCYRPSSNVFFAVGELGRIAKIELTSSSTATLTESDSTPVTYDSIAWSGVCWSPYLNAFILVPRYGVKNSGSDYCAGVSSDGLFVDGIAALRSGDWTSINAFPDMGNPDETHVEYPLLYVTGNTTTGEAYTVNETPDGEVPVTTGVKVGETFTTPRRGGIRLDSIVLRLKLSASSSESKDMTVGIYTLSAGVPSVLVGTSAVVNKNTLTTDYQDVEFTFTDLRLEADKDYAFVFSVSDSYTQYVIMETNSTDVWTGGYAVSSYNGSWSASYTYDLSKFSISMSFCDSDGNNFDYAAMTRKPSSSYFRMRDLGEWDLKASAYSHSLKRICTVGYWTVATQDITFNLEEVFTNMNTVSKEIADLIPAYSSPDISELESDTANITGAVFGITGQAIQLNGIKTMQTGINLNGGSELDVYDEGSLYDVTNAGSANTFFGLLATGKFAQTFTTPAIGGVTVGTISLRIKLSASSVESSNMYVAIYTTSSDVPDTLVGTSAAVNKNTLTTDYQTVEFDMGGLHLSSSTVYAFVFWVDGAYTQYPIFEMDDPGSFAGILLTYAPSSWTKQTGYDLSNFTIEITSTPVSDNDTADGPAPITVNWCKFTRIGFVCFIDLSVTWGSQTVDQAATFASLGSLPFDGESGFFQFLSMDEARDTEAYSVYYTHTPYIYNGSLYFKKSEDMLVEYDAGPEPLAIPNGLAGRTTRISGFYFVA